MYANEVADALDKANIDGSGLRLVWQSEVDSEAHEDRYVNDKTWNLDYDELHALHIYMIQCQQKKRENRIEHISQLSKSKQTSDIKLRIIALKARIDGSRIAEGAEVVKLNVLLKGSDWKIVKKLSEAEMQYDMCDKIIQGVERYQNLSFIDKLKLKRGYPLNCSIFKLIRG